MNKFKPRVILRGKAGDNSSSMLQWCRTTFGVDAEGVTWALKASNTLVDPVSFELMWIASFFSDNEADAVLFTLRWKWLHSTVRHWTVQYGNFLLSQQKRCNADSGMTKRSVCDAGTNQSTSLDLVASITVWSALLEEFQQNRCQAISDAYFPTDKRYNNQRRISRKVS